MLAGIDRSLEESARVLGATPRLTFRKIVVPLAMPALLSATLIIFVNAIGDFGIPGALGYRDKIEVIPTALVRLVTIFPSDPNRATVLGIALMAITIACLAISRRLIAGRSFTTLGVRGSGRGAAGAAGAAGWTAFGFIALYILLALVLPVLAMAVTSFQKFPNPNLFKAAYTLDNYRFVLTFPAIGRSIVNSALLAVGAAVAGTVLAAVVGYLVVKTKNGATVVLDYIGSSTLAIPHTVFGLGILWFWVSIPAGIYGTRWILLFAYVAFFFPYALRAAINAFLQVDKSMEEAGRVFGASWQKTVVAIIVPIIVPGLLSGATIIIYHAFRELSGSLLLYSPGGEVMATALWGLYVEGRFVELFALAMFNIVIVLALVGLATLLARRTQSRA
jgi:iron(III) transport system permease protein